MPESPEIQQLLNEYYATMGMITYCNETGTNPDKYIKQATTILNKLRRLNYELIFILEKHLQDRIR